MFGEPPEPHNNGDVTGTIVGTLVLPADETELHRSLGQFRPFLRAQAEGELPQGLQGKLDPSDLVQETLLRGVRHFGQFRGTTERELTAWLTEILRNYLAEVRRGFHRRGRDVRREQPLIDVPCLNSPSASELVRQTEAKERLHHAMSQLSEEHRTVLDLRQLQELTFPEIGVRMERSTDAARMLWGRAIAQLGRLLRHDDQ